jgi:hypothetical protein
MLVTNIGSSLMTFLGVTPTKGTHVSEEAEILVFR